MAANVARRALIPMAEALALPRAFGFAGEQLRRWAAGEPLVNVVADAHR